MVLRYLFRGTRPAVAAEPSAAGKPGEVLTDAEAAAGVNVKTAIDAHIRWKHRLEGYLRGTSGEVLLPQVVAADNQCVLGKWIHGEGARRYGHVDVFQELVHVHAEFHQHAGQVLTTAQRGEFDAAMQLLQTGDYSKTSNRVKRLLARLYVDVFREDARGAA